MRSALLLAGLSCGCLMDNPEYLGPGGNTEGGAGSATALSSSTGAATSQTSQTSQMTAGASDSTASTTTAGPCTPQTCSGNALCVQADARPYRVAVGDVTATTQLDIVAISRDGMLVEVWEVSAEGSFAGLHAYALDAQPVSVAVVDSNGDGGDEIALGRAGLDGVVLLDPRSGSRTPFDVGGEVASLAAADATMDGNTDLALGVTGSDNFVVWAISDGAGGFALGGPAKADGNVHTVVQGNLSGGGAPGVVALTDAEAGLFSYATDAVGDLATGVRSAVAGAYDVAVADLDHDGRPELVATIGSSVDVLLEDANLTFAPKQTLELNAMAGQVRVADLDLDGEPELIVALRDAAEVRVFEGTPDLDYGAPVRTELPGAGDALALGDFNGDGRPDIVATVPDTSQVCVILSEPT